MWPHQGPYNQRCVARQTMGGPGGCVQSRKRHEVNITMRPSLITWLIMSQGSSGAGRLVSRNSWSVSKLLSQSVDCLLSGSLRWTIPTTNPFWSYPSVQLFYPSVQLFYPSVRLFYLSVQIFYPSVQLFYLSVQLFYPSVQLFYLSVQL